MHRTSPPAAPRDTHTSWRAVRDILALLLAWLAIARFWRPATDRASHAPTSRPGYAPGDTLSYPRPMPRTPEGEMILPTAEHEAADVGGRFIGGAFALLFVSLAVITVCVVWLFPMPTTDRTLHGPLPTYPEPRLQNSPRNDMQRFLTQEMGQLTSYGWVDKVHGVVHLPIDVAMSKIAQRGIPDWPTPSGQSAAASALPASSGTTVGATR